MSRIISSQFSCIIPLRLSITIVSLLEFYHAFSMRDPLTQNLIQDIACIMLLLTCTPVMLTRSSPGLLNTTSAIYQHALVSAIIYAAISRSVHGIESHHRHVHSSMQSEKLFRRATETEA